MGLQGTALWFVMNETNTFVQVREHRLANIALCYIVCSVGETIRESKVFFFLFFICGGRKEKAFPASLQLAVAQVS